VLGRKRAGIFGGFSRIGLVLGDDEFDRLPPTVFGSSLNALL
jgi:hypothetical protein